MEGPVKVLPISSTDINRKNADLHLRDIVKNAKTIVGISRAHCIFANDTSFKTSLLTQEKIKAPNSSVKVGDWYMVEYDGKCYPGEVQKKLNGEYLISTMEQAGNNWKWPSRPDEVFYTEKQLIRKLNVPTVVNSRGHCKFQ